MTNRLSSIFSIEPCKYAAHFKFKNGKDRKVFISNLKKMLDEGEEYSTDSIDIIIDAITDGNTKLPVNKEIKAAETRLSFPEKEIAFPFKHGNTVIPIKIILIDSNKHLIIKTPDNEIVNLEFKLSKEKDEVKFTYRINIESADTSKDVIDAYNKALIIIENVIKVGEDNNSEEREVFDLIDSFRAAREFWIKVNSIETTADILITPKEIEDIENTVENVNEIYAMVVENKVVRKHLKSLTSNAKLIDRDKLKKDEKLEVSFLDQSEYSVMDFPITVFTVNYAGNLMIKKIETISDREIKIFYGDTDSKPMYIAKKGFLRLEDAEKEIENIASKIDEYRQQ